MVSLCNLKPDTLRVIRKLVQEVAIRKTRRSIPVKLGSKSEVLIRPTLDQTRNPGVPDKDYPSAAHIKNKVP